jgi:hypothetical protein
MYESKKRLFCGAVRAIQTNQHFAGKSVEGGDLRENAKFKLGQKNIPRLVPLL